MKNLLFLFLSCLSIPLWAAGPSRIYFYDGFVVPVPIASEIRAHYAIEDFIKAKFPEAKFYATHFLFPIRDCEDIQKLKPEERPEKIILLGHSLGVSAANDAARCLKDIPVDLIIAIDGTPETDSSVLVPPNVIEYYNYYQTLDLFVRGLKESRRPGTDQTGVNNIFIDVPFSLWPHLQIVDELFERNLILSLIDKVIENKQPTIGLK